MTTMNYGKPRTYLKGSFKRPSLHRSEKRPGDSAENSTPVYEVEAFTFQDLVGPWSEFCHCGGFSPSF